MNYTLPVAVAVGGREYAIRSDFRAALDICAVLSDPELTDTEKAWASLVIFYPDAEQMPEADYPEALRALLDFLTCGEPEPRRGAPKLVSWEQDFTKIVSAINKTTGTDVRAADYLHWWTFISYFNEIDGETTFAAIVRIRAKLRRHQRLSKEEQDFYRMNRESVDFRSRYTEEEADFLARLVEGQRKSPP